MPIEDARNRWKIAKALLIAGLCLSIAAGYFGGPYAYPFLKRLPIYNCIKNMWSLLSTIGIGALDIYLCPKLMIQWIFEKVQSIHSSLLRSFGYVVLIIVYFSFIGLTFEWAVAVFTPVKDNPPYGDGTSKSLDELESDFKIYITIVLEDGSKPQNRDIQYKIVSVQRETLPPWKIILDSPRYLARQAEGITPIKVTVRPNDGISDFVIRFSDPLISYGKEAVMWTSNKSLLSDVSTQQGQSDYFPWFEYSYDGDSWEKYLISGTENRLALQSKTVFLRWNNNWKLSLRDILNEQKITVNAGDTVDFYYPGERVELNLDMINQSNASNPMLAHKVKTVKQYGLSLESVDDQTVYCDRSITINSEIAASDLPKLSPCIIKAGTEIIYHCYDGSNDLGYYYIAVDNGTTVWEETKLGQKEVAVLRLDMD